MKRIPYSKYSPLALKLALVYIRTNKIGRLRERLISPDFHIKQKKVAKEELIERMSELVNLQRSVQEFKRLPD